MAEGDNDGSSPWQEPAWEMRITAPESATDASSMEAFLDDVAFYAMSEAALKGFDVHVTAALLPALP